MKSEMIRNKKTQGVVVEFDFVLFIFGYEKVVVKRERKCVTGRNTFIIYIPSEHIES